MATYLEAQRVGEKLVEAHLDLAEPATVLASVCLHLGRLQQEQGQSQDARQTLRRALELRSRFTHYPVNMLDIFYEHSTPNQVRKAILSELGPDAPQ